MWSQFTNVTDR